MELGRVIKHEIRIVPSHNKGFTVTIGCGTFVFKNAEDMISALNAYLADPEKWEAERPQTVGYSDDVAPPERPRGDQPLGEAPAPEGQERARRR